VTKGATRAMLEQAEVMGFSGNAAERVVKNAIGLAKGNEELSRTYIRVTAALEQGNLQLLRRIPGLRGIKDESELVAKAQHLIASGLKVAEAETESSIGKIEHLKHSFHALFIDLGGAVATVFNPVVSGLKMAVDWFGSLDKVTKVLAMGLPSLLLGLHGLGATTTILAKLGLVKVAADATMLGKAVSLLLSPLRLIGTSVAAVFSPMGIAIAAVVGAGSLLINHLGGLSAAWDKMKSAASDTWDYVKGKVSEFAEWFQPVADEMATLGSEIWEKTKQASSDLREFMRDVWADIKTVGKDVWDSIGVTASINWAKIKSDVLLALWSIEFSFRNIKLTAQVAWTQIGIWTSQAVDGIKDIWAGLRATFEGTWQSIVAGAKAAWHNVKVVFGSGEEWQSIGDAMGSAFSKAFDESLGRSNVGDSDYTKQLKKQYADLGGQLSESFQEFRKRKEDELGKGGGTQPTEKEKDEGKKKWGDTGGILGGAFGKGIHEGMKKVDAALFGSSEALTHIQEYISSFNAPAKKAEIAHAVAPEDETADAVRDVGDRQVALLDKIVKNTAQRDTGPSITIAPANLGIA